MRNRTKTWLARLALPLVLALAGCPAPNHDDDDDSASPADDDTADDDTTIADDDAGDDDNMEDYGPRTDDGSAPYHPDFLRD